MDVNHPKSCLPHLPHIFPKITQVEHGNGRALWAEVQSKFHKKSRNSGHFREEKTIFQEIKKDSIFNAEVSDKKRQCRNVNTKRSAGFERKKARQTLYTKSKSSGCSSKTCTALEKRGQKNGTGVIQMRTKGIFKEEIMVQKFNEKQTLFSNGTS